jgi:hypothetical protein
VAPALSVLSDRDDWMYNDYGSVIRALRAGAERNAVLEKELAEAKSASENGRSRAVVEKAPRVAPFIIAG